MTRDGCISLSENSVCVSIAVNDLLIVAPFKSLLGQAGANGCFSIAAYVKSGLIMSSYVPSSLDLPCRCAVTELVLLFEVGVWPPHDGVRRMEWFNLSGALTSNEAGSAAVANSLHPSSP
jgi:hypothetical protein